MGNSGLVLKGSTLTHVHFEVKATPTAGNVRGAHEYFGYTPGHPDYEGYEDPRDLVDGIAVEAIPSTALRVLAPGPVLVRASPGEIYSPGVPTAVTDRIDAGTAFVAFKHAVAEGRDWYFIDLPSRNRPLQGSYYPNNGPTGGWVDAALVAIEPAGPQAEIHRDGAFIRSRPRSSARLLARAYSAQRFVVSGAPKRSPGVSCTWYPVDLPEGLPVVLGWICGRSLALLSAGSASSP
jgi:hypothetical protein